jgi:hypothetical protein
MARGKEVVTPTEHFAGSLTELGWDVYHIRSNLKVIAGLKVRTAKRFVVFLEQPKLLEAIEVLANLGPDQNPEERLLDLVGWANQCGLQANKGVYMGACWSNLTLAGVDVRTLRPDDWMNEPTVPPPAPPAPTPPPPAVQAPAPAVQAPPAKPSSPPSAKIVPVGAVTPPDFDPDPLASYRAQAEKAAKVAPPNEQKKKDGDSEATLQTEGDYQHLSVTYRGDVDVEVDVVVTLPTFDPESWKVTMNGKEANLDHDLDRKTGATVLKVTATAHVQHEDELSFTFDRTGGDVTDWLPLRRIVELAYRQDPTLCRQLAAELAMQGDGSAEALFVAEGVVRNGGVA